MLIEYHGASDEEAKVLANNGWIIKPWSTDYDMPDMPRALKDFSSFSGAIREVEKLLDVDVIQEESQDGCPIHSFMCQETSESCSGWECGKHIYNSWADTPRAVLDELNSSSLPTRLSKEELFKAYDEWYEKFTTIKGHPPFGVEIASKFYRLGWNNGSNLTSPPDTVE